MLTALFLILCLLASGTSLTLLALLGVVWLHLHGVLAPAPKGKDGKACDATSR